MELGRAGFGRRTNREPSIRLKQSSVTTSSSEPRISQILLAIHLRGATTRLACGQPDPDPGRRGAHAYFFMTWRLTFCMSTFWLNSGGNLVARKSFWSTVAAMFAQRWCELRGVEAPFDAEVPGSKCVEEAQ